MGLTAWIFSGLGYVWEKVFTASMRNIIEYGIIWGIAGIILYLVYRFLKMIVPPLGHISLMIAKHLLRIPGRFLAHIKKTQASPGAGVTYGLLVEYLAIWVYLLSRTNLNIGELAFFMAVSIYTLKWVWPKARTIAARIAGGKIEPAE